MFQIPFYSLLIIYSLFLLLFFLFAFFDLYHMIKFGHWDYSGFFMTFIFIGGIVIILFLTWQYGSQIDWSQSFNLFESNFKNINEFGI